MTKRVIEIPVDPHDNYHHASSTYVRWWMSQHQKWGGMTDEMLGKEFGFTGSYVGMVLSGARPLSKKFLKAIGWERVIFYRKRK
jgi:hypothetical protein